MRAVSVADFWRAAFERAALERADVADFRAPTPGLAAESCALTRANSGAEQVRETTSGARIRARIRA